MWRVEDFDVKPVEFDFSSSGQGRHVSSAIEAAGIRLVNALDLVEFDPASTQVHLCSCCGFSYCEPRNWVALRRLGDLVVWVPAFARMASGDWERQEYSPPGFMASRGAPLFLPSAWEKLRRRRNDIPEASHLPPLHSREAVQVLQWSAPRRLLGTYPVEPRLQRDGVVAVTDGDLEAEVRAVDLALERYFIRPDALNVVPVAEVRSRIEFWLDLPGIPAWSPFGRSDTGILLLLGDELALSPTVG